MKCFRCKLHLTVYHLGKTVAEAPEIKTQVIKGIQLVMYKRKTKTNVRVNGRTSGNQSERT